MDTGALTLGGYLRPGVAGVSLDVEAKVRRALALYGRGWAEYDRTLRDWSYGAEGGLRLQW